MNIAKTIVFFLGLALSAEVSWAGESCQFFRYFVQATSVRAVIGDSMPSNLWNIPTLHRLKLNLTGTAKMRNRDSKGYLKDGTSMISIDELFTTTVVSHGAQENEPFGMYVDGEQAFHDIYSFPVPVLLPLGMIDTATSELIFNDRFKVFFEIEENFCRSSIFGRYKLRAHWPSVYIKY